MSTIQTRQKILDSALLLFNRDGLVNVRLQHIADEAFVSIGNMAYHYRTKAHILMAIWEQLEKEQREVLAEFKVLPLFEDMERLLRREYALQSAYSFYYMDALEISRAYPDIAQVHQAYDSWRTQQLETMIQFNVARGAFIAEPFEGYYAQLARQFWMNSDLWRYYQAVRGNNLNGYDTFRDALWALFIPVFSDMGRREFIQLNALILENLF